jgi:hypothetical protein
MVPLDIITEEQEQYHEKECYNDSKVYER